jgi:peptide/nickel transport system substrate-binding protein
MIASRSMQHQLRHDLQTKLCRLGAVLLAVLAGCRVGAEDAHKRDSLKVVLPRDVQQLDPRFVSDPYGHKLSRLIFASLLRIDPQSLEPVPDLAQSVDVVSDREYRAHLRPGLRFSDGSTLDAEDVVATFRSVVDPELHARYASSYQRIASVDALDPLTVRFVLKGVHASFLTDLEFPIMRAEDAHRRLTLEGAAPIGAGPYVLAHRQPGLIELAPDPYWYAGTPHIPYIRMLVVRDDNTRALRLLSGAADFALNSIPPGLRPLFTASKGFEVDSAKGIGITYIGVNTEAPALRDVRVRRALAYAIDRPSLIAAKFAGRATPAESFIPRGHWAYAPDTPRYDFDPAKARALLAEAGVSKLHLQLRCSSERARMSIARAIAAMWADVGVEVQVQPIESATLIADLDRGRFELTLLQFQEVIEPHVLSWFFSSDHIPGHGHQGSNRWRYRDAALDAAFERGRSHIDRDTRRAAYADVQRILAEQLPVIPLWHEAVVAVRSVRAPSIVVPRDGRFTTFAR